jgi:hypothetical protein
MPDIEELPICRRRDGQIVRYVPLGGQERPYTVDRLFLLARETGPAARLERLDPVDGFSAILSSAYSPEGAIAAPALKGFAATMGGADCYRIVYSGLDEAVQAIAGAAGE